MVSLADHARWLGSFFRHGTRVASLAPTGRRLAREMCREIDSETPQRILELGTGMGTVTRTALELKHPESELVSIELDAKLLEVAQRTAPGTTFIHGSVGDLPKLLDEHGWDQFDVCISCLPVPSLPKKVNQTVIETWEERCTSSVFSQLTAIPWVYWGMYRKMFHHVSFNLVWLNTPPAGVYHCRTLRDDFSSDGRLAGH